MPVSRARPTKGNALANREQPKQPKAPATQASPLLRAQNTADRKSEDRVINLLTNVLSPAGIQRLHIIVAASATILAFGFAAIIILAA